MQTQWKEALGSVDKSMSHSELRGNAWFFRNIDQEIERLKKWGCWNGYVRHSTNTIQGEFVGNTIYQDYQEWLTGEKGVKVTKQFSGGSPLQTRADRKSDQARAH